MLRNVIITSKGGASTKRITTDVRTWGELVPLLKEAGVEVSGQKAIVAGLSHTLDNKDAVLPQGAFTILLTPVKVKAGASSLDYKAARTFLKKTRMEAAENEDEQLLSIIGNYTHDSTEELNRKVDAVNEYINSSVQSNSSVPTEWMNRMNERMAEVEFALGIVNDENNALFTERNKESITQYESNVIA